MTLADGAVRKTICFTAPAADDLEFVKEAAREGNSEATSRGVRIYARALRAQEAGGRLLIEDADGTQTRIEFL